MLDEIMLVEKIAGKHNLQTLSSTVRDGYAKELEEKWKSDRLECGEAAVEVNDGPVGEFSRQKGSVHSTKVKLERVAAVVTPAENILQPD